MTHRVITTTTRPNIDTPFWWQVQPDLAYARDAVHAQYKSEDKLLSETRSLSEDGLVFYYTGDYVSREAYDDRCAEPAIIQMINFRYTHETANGIVREESSIDF